MSISASAGYPGPYKHERSALEGAFFYIGKLMHKKLIYIEPFDRVHTRSLTGRL